MILLSLSLCDAKFSVSKRARGDPNKRMEMISHNTTLTLRRDGAAITNLPFARTLSAALAVTALVATGTPALATTHHHHHHRAAQSLNGLRMYAGESLDQHDQVLGAMPMSESRAQVMHDCNMKAQPYSFSTWQTTQFSVYGTCMTEHGQIP
jgi:hypothetical protein